MIAGLLGTAVLAGMFSAAQLLPVMEFTQKTERASEDGTHDIFPFSLEFHRVAEFAWPGVFGQNTLGNRSWHSLIPPRHRIEFWVPSLYIGGLSLVLALAAVGFRDSRRAWLTAILLISLFASFGRFASPLWVARNIPAVARWIGPFDPMDTGPIRRDFLLRDGEGGIYWLLATTLPGFASFRYPSKLLTFTVVALSGLAGMGWEDALARRARRAGSFAGALLVFSLIGLALAYTARPEILKAFNAHAGGAGTGSFGPFDPEGAWKEIRDAFLLGSFVFGGSFFVLAGVCRPGLLGKFSAALALPLLTADLILANAGLVYTVPQDFFEIKPEALKRIEEAEARDPSPGPYRIHRLPAWEPPGWGMNASPDRVRDLVRWERKTLQPKYGLPLGVSYTLAMGVGELYDYDWFFNPFHWKLIDPKGPRTEANKFIYYPRRGFDLWNSRYFILPSVSRNEPTHATFSLLDNIVAIYPRPDQVDGPENKDHQDRWMKDEDWRIVRNRNAYPRAWIVHDVEIHTPIADMRTSEDRVELTYKILYQADQYWTMSNRTVYDLRRVAFVEVDVEAGVRLAASMSHRGPDASEKADVRLIGDEEVHIDAELASPGLIVLSDVFYPGWEVTLDGGPAVMYRTNRLMRGVAVPSGKHTLIFRYRSRTIMLGLIVSALGLIGLIGTGIWARRQPREERPFLP